MLRKRSKCTSRVVVVLAFMMLPWTTGAFASEVVVFGETFRSDVDPPGNWFEALDQMAADSLQCEPTMIYRTERRESHGCSTYGGNCISKLHLKASYACHATSGRFIRAKGEARWRPEDPEHAIADAMNDARQYAVKWCQKPVLYDMRDRVVQVKNDMVFVEGVLDCEVY